MSSPTKHTQLPSEILLIISKLCSFRTLKSLRLANRIFDNANVISGIFEDVYLAPFEYSIINLIQISKSTKINRLVNKIILCGAHLRTIPFQRWTETIALEALNNYEDGSGFFEAYEQFPRVGKPAFPEAILRNRNLEACYQMYANMVKEQNGFDSIAEKYMLHDAIGKFQSLQVFEMEDGFDLRSKNDSSPPWLNLWPKILILPQFDLRTKTKDYSAPFCFIRDALRMGQANPTSLKLISCEVSSFPSYHPDCSVENKHGRLFYNLSQLELSIRGFAVYGQGLESMLNFGRIADQLKCAPGLKSLKLHVRDEICFLTFPHFRTLILPELEDLEIGFCFKQDSLQQFLANQKRTLRRLTFTGASLMPKDGGSWAGLLEKIPQILNLKDVELRGLWVSPMNFDDPKMEKFQRMVSDNLWSAQYKRFVVNADVPPTFDAEQWHAMYSQHTDVMFSMFSGSTDQSYVAKVIREGQVALGMLSHERGSLEMDRVRNHAFLEAGESDTESDIREEN